MNSLPGWQRWAFLIAAISIIAGISFLLALSGRQEPVLDRVPEDVVNQVPTPEEALPTEGSDQRSGGVLVLPSEILAEGITSGTELPPITIANRSNQQQDLEVQFIPVYRTLIGGAPVIEPTPQRLAEGRQLVALDKSKFTLGPQQSTKVTPTIVGRPENGIIIGSIATTIIDRDPRLSDPVKNNVRVGVQNNIRINSMVYLSWPEAVDPRSTLQRVRATQNSDDSLKFLIRAQGAQGVSSPQGQVEVFDSSGQRVAQAQIDGSQRVIPEAERDLVVEEAIGPLDPGQYRATATLSSGRSAQTVDWSFSIDQNGKLPAPAATVALQASPTQVQAGQAVEVLVQVENSGEKDFAPQGSLELYEYGQQRIIDQRQIRLPALGPGDIEEQRETIPAPSKPGNYEVVVELNADDGSLLDQRVVSFMVGGTQAPEAGALTQFRDWISANPLGAVAVAILGFGLLIAVILGAIALIGRARRR